MGMAWRRTDLRYEKGRDEEVMSGQLDDPRFAILVAPDDPQRARIEQRSVRGIEPEVAVILLDHIPLPIRLCYQRVRLDMHVHRLARKRTCQCRNEEM